MGTETGSSAADADPAPEPERELADAPPAETDRQIGETLEALRDLSFRLASIEQRLSAERPDPETDSEIRDPWEAAVRRFTGSIDLRLDILENELGEVQNELAQLQEAADARIHSMERRLTRRYLAGQILLAAVIVLLSFMVWSARGVTMTEPPSSTAGAQGNDVELAVRPGAGPSQVAPQRPQDSTPPAGTSGPEGPDSNPGDPSAGTAAETGPPGEAAGADSLPGDGANEPQSGQDAPAGTGEQTSDSAGSAPRGEPSSSDEP